MMIKVSIIIPCYNASAFIVDAIDNALASEFPLSHFEIIVVNDGSTDDSENLINDRFDDSTVKYFSQANKGLSGARNSGIRHASGKYLIFLDADDLIAPNKLREQFDYLEANEDVDVVYSKSKCFTDIGERRRDIDVSFPPYQGFVLKNLLFGNFLHVNSAMVRTSVVRDIGCFNESYRELEDWDLWLRLSINGSKFAFIPKVLSSVRVHGESMTANQGRMNKAMVKVLSNLKSELIQVLGNESYLFYQALSQFKIKVKDWSFWNDNFFALRHFGLSYFGAFFKLTLKMILIPFLPNQNQTTKGLEQVWNNG